jgi:hypothetical protein
MRRLLFGAAVVLVMMTSQVQAQVAGIVYPKIIQFMSDRTTKGPAVSFGAADPSAGADGDVYLQFPGAIIWTKVSGTWTRTGNVRTDRANTFGAYDQTFGGHILASTAWTSDIGAAALKLRTAYLDELNVQTLIATSVRSTIGGELLTAPTTYLAADLTAGATSISVKHNNLVNGDRIWLQANGNVEWMAVASGASGAGPYTYSVTRNLDGTGANSWYTGDAVVDTGTTGAGFIDQRAGVGILGRAYGPTLEGLVRTGTTFSDVATRWACGNLNGLYGYATNIYGCGFGTPAGNRLTIEPTNGINIYDSAGTARVTIGPGATATFTGDGSGITAINGGNITTGTVTATQIASNTITASQIAASTITANEIAASTITAGKMNVSTLSAIAADLGTITAGTVTGATIQTAASGARALMDGTNLRSVDSSGTTLARMDGHGLKIAPQSTGAGWPNNDYYYGFIGHDGSGLAYMEQYGGGTNDYVTIVSPGMFRLDTGGGANSYYFRTGAGTAAAFSNSGGSLGEWSAHWGQIYVDKIYNDPDATSSGDWPVVYSSGNHFFYYKDNGLNETSGCSSGSFVNGWTIERGFVVSFNCDTPAPLSSLTRDLVDLRAEVSALRSLVSQLRAGGITEPAGAGELRGPRR